MKPTREQVIAWARESELGFLLGENWMMLEALECFATLAYEAGRKDENEACVEVIMPNATPMEIAAAIRTRREQ